MKISHDIGSKILLLYFLLLLLFLGLCLVNVKHVFAETSIGVLPGQFLHYSLCGIVSGNDSAFMNQSEFNSFCNITVNEVNNSQIRFITVWYNATYSSEEFFRYEDVATGIGLEDHLYGYEPFFVAANLTAGDPLVNSSKSSGYLMTINETISTDYLGFPRETNHVVLEGEGKETLNNVTVNCNSTYQYFLDKLTGASVRLIFDIQYSRVNESDLLVTKTRYEYVLLSTEPTIPEFAPVLLLIFLCTASLMLVAISRAPLQDFYLHILATLTHERLEIILAREPFGSLARSRRYAKKPNPQN